MRARYTLTLCATMSCADPDTAIEPWPIPITSATMDAATSRLDAAFPPFPRIDSSIPRVDSGPSSPVFPRNPMCSDLTLGLDVFDPNEIYIFGNLNLSACNGGRAVAPVLMPNLPSIGFDCEVAASTARIRPTDGRLLYLVSSDSKAVHVYRGDVCTASSNSFNAGYPQYPAENDGLIPAPSCSGTSFGLNDIRVAPDGQTLHRCTNNWYDTAGTLVMPAEPALLALGAAGTALRQDGLVDLATSAVTPLRGLPALEPLTVRVLPDGYWVVTPGTEQANRPELWRVALDGSAAQVGVYPEPPNAGRLESPKLDGQGRLYQIAMIFTGTDQDTVIRRNVQGESTVVYTEQTQPKVKLQISALVTGP